MMILGIDGEGAGTDNHRYILLAASDCTGAVYDFVEAQSLTTKDCLEFILRLPTKAEIFAYSFGYDLTKILADVDNDLLYLLYHPELRPGKYMPEPVQWREYFLNWQGARFSVKRRGREEKIIWDIFKFFQRSFVDSLVEWKISDREALLHIANMKKQRSHFELQSVSAIRNYCLEECKQLAKLAAHLKKAHEDAKLELAQFHGPGSTASALLNRLGIGEHKRSVISAMATPVACAFAGGRFENAVIGRIKGPIYARDINSAYPYQTHNLPCLNHGRWYRTNKESDIESLKVKAALIHYDYRATKKEPWAPFFFRDDKHCISYPSRGKGWVWREEYLAARRGWNGIRFDGAWLYESDCDCKPFAVVPEIYNERQRIGKDGKGIVLKLALNSLYGKLAQSIGHPKFQCWIWAGMITSGCRAQVLDAIAAHKDRNSVLWVATDGIYTREPVTLPKPRDTGTDALGKPLGAWDEKVIEGDMFAVRPGIYFEIADGTLRGRGLGRRLLAESKHAIMNAYETGQDAVTLESVRFHGAKSSLSLKADGRVVRSPNYGQWRPWSVTLTFDPMPKRRLGPNGELLLRAYDGESAPYDKADDSPEQAYYAALEAMFCEQPDCY